MKRKLFFVILMLCLAMTGCTENPPETTVTTAPPATTEPTVPPTTVPPTTVPPTTEPEVILEAGPAVTADGDELISGSVLYEGVPYMNVGEFLMALDNSGYTGNETHGYVLIRNGREFQFHPDPAKLTRDGVTLALEFPVMRYQGALWVPVEEICQVMDVSFLEDTEQNHLYCTSVGRGWDWARGVDIPILMYHGVTDDTWGAAELFVSPEDLEEQIVWLLDNGYDPITFEDWSHLEDFDKPIMLTFDDGYMDNYKEMFPIIQKYGVKVTICLIAYNIDNRDSTLTTEQIREMQASGLVSFQSHTYGHPYLSECDTERLYKEMRLSRLIITRITGYEPFVLCYPYGDSSPQVRELAMEYYRFAMAMTGGLYTTGDDVSQITRYYVSRYTNIWDFAAMAKGG